MRPVRGPTWARRATGSPRGSSGALSRTVERVARPDISGDPFEALGDSNRRQILRLLSDGDKPVQEIADAMSISRPAVSRHLRLLKDAGMVAEQAQGTRRIYHLQEQGMEAVQAYLEGVWGEAAARFRLLGENTDERSGSMSEPLKLSFDVACSPEHAFRVWTSSIGTWWPSDHTVSGQAGLEIVLQGGVGGRIYERTAEGVENDWGKVTIWEPPTRLAYEWHLRQDRADATEVEIRFRAQGASATRVEIEHRGWERLGRSGGERRAQNRSRLGDTAPALSCRNRKRSRLMAAGTRIDPWVLKTPPGTSEYTMYQGRAGRPASSCMSSGLDHTQVPLAGHRRSPCLAGRAGRLGRARCGRREEAGGIGQRRGVGAFTGQPRRRLVRPT